MSQSDQFDNYNGGNGKKDSFSDAYTSESRVDIYSTPNVYGDDRDISQNAVDEVKQEENEGVENVVAGTDAESESADVKQGTDADAETENTAADQEGGIVEPEEGAADQNSNSLTDNKLYDGGDDSEQTVKGNEPYSDSLYSGGANADNAQENDPYINSPYSKSAYDADSYEDSAQGNNPYSENQFEDNPYGNNVQSNNLYNNSRYGNNAQGSNPYGNNQYGSNAQGSNPYGNSQYDSNAQGGNLYGSDQYGSNGQSGNPYINNQYGGNAQGSNPYGNDRYGSNAQGSNPYGNNWYGSNAQGSNPYGNSQYGSNAQGSNPYGNSQYGSNAQGGNPYGNSQYGNNTQGGIPYGNNPYGNIPQDNQYSPYAVPHKKNNTGLIIGIVVAVIVLFLIAIFALAYKAVALFTQESNKDNISREEYNFDDDDTNRDRDRQSDDDFYFEYDPYDDYYGYDYYDDYGYDFSEQFPYGFGGYDYDDYDYDYDNDKYYTLHDDVKTGLSYSVDFDYYEYDAEDDNVMILVSYPIIIGDNVPNLDKLNKTIQEEKDLFTEYFEEEYKEHMSDSDSYFSALATGYVTYMDEEKMSIVFSESVYSDYYEDVYLYCINIDMENGVILNNENLINVDDNFSVEFRRMSNIQNGEISYLTMMSDQQITNYFNSSDVIVFYTPKGMEIGFNCDEGWVTVTYEEYEKYLKVL